MGRSRQAASWSSLIAGVLILVWLFNAAATNALGDVGQAKPTGALGEQGLLHPPSAQRGIHAGADRLPSPATAALADGDDVQARFVASLASQGLGYPSMPSSSP
jgi:hypothetical protein